MDKNFFENEVEKALEVLRSGGVILYPTDTVWGIGCDATNKEAVNNIFKIKKRADHKSMIILLADEREILKYVASPHPGVFDFIQEQTRPTSVIFEHALGLPDNLIGEDGSIAIRLTNDNFCRHLVKRLRKPLVSTSANTSGEATPKTFMEISESIKLAVDHVVKWRQEDYSLTLPSQVVRYGEDGKVTVIRK